MARDLTVLEVRALTRPGVHRVSRNLYVQVCAFRGNVISESGGT